jgi:hypothetical protein
MRRAKDRATDLPDADLFTRVKEVTGLEEESAPASGSRRRTSTGSSRSRARSTGTTRQAASRRKTTSTSR